MFLPEKKIAGKKQPKIIFLIFLPKKKNKQSKKQKLNEASAWFPSGKKKHIYIYITKTQISLTIIYLIYLHLDSFWIVFGVIAGTYTSPIECLGNETKRTKNENPRRPQSTNSPTESLLGPRAVQTLTNWIPPEEILPQEDWIFPGKNIFELPGTSIFETTWVFHVQHQQAESPSYVNWATFKNLMTFHYTGWFMTGSLQWFMNQWNNPHLIG